MKKKLMEALAHLSGVRAPKMKKDDALQTLLSQREDTEPTPTAKATEAWLQQGIAHHAAKHS